MGSNLKDAGNAKNEIISQIEKLHCSMEKISILYTKNTEKTAKKMFTDSFAPCLCPLEDFRGCENSVIICFYSSDQDETWQLMTMASRAQQRLYVINDATKKEVSICIEME